MSYADEQRALFLRENLSEAQLNKMQIEKESSLSYLEQQLEMRLQPSEDYIYHEDNIEEQNQEQALRYNEGKTEYSLIDLSMLKHTADVLSFGAQKYSRGNWKKGMNTSKILDSLLRHIAAIQAGEVIDPESGLPHIGHIGANAMFLGNAANVQDVQVLPNSPKEEENE